MYVPTHAIPQIAAEFVSSVVLPKAPTGLMQFGIGFFLPYLTNAVKAKLEQVSPALRAMGVADEHGRIDLAAAKSAAQQALQQAGGKVDVYGYTADASDIDALFQIAQKHAVN